MSNLISGGTTRSASLPSFLAPQQVLESSNNQSLPSQFSRGQKSALRKN